MKFSKLFNMPDGNQILFYFLRGKGKYTIYFKSMFYYVEIEGTAEYGSNLTMHRYFDEIDKEVALSVYLDLKKSYSESVANRKFSIDNLPDNYTEIA